MKNIILMLSPVVVLFFLIVVVFFLKNTTAEFQISVNEISLIGLTLIILGIITGLVSLVKPSPIKLWWKLLIFILYFPTVLVSLLISGW